MKLMMISLVHALEMRQNVDVVQFEDVIAQSRRRGGRRMLYQLVIRLTYHP
jgi:hypothetical protein